MIGAYSKLIYSSETMKAKLKNIEDLVKKFDNVKMKSQLQHAKFLDDFKTIMGIDDAKS